jgi:hypothetical protein
MKKVPCSYEKCGKIRPHFESSEESRPTQWIEVPDDFAGRAYCSVECAAYAKALKIKKDNFLESL